MPVTTGCCGKLTGHISWRAVLGVAFLCATLGCARADDVTPGMSSAAVVRALGEPSRKAVLVGKELRDLDEAEAPNDFGGRRLVYFYDGTGLQVWFQNGVVTGVVRDGVRDP